MTEKPFVSIIIVNYNGWHYLPACLNALKQQTYPADCFEVIVSDNASKDGSVAQLKELYPWVRVLENDRNYGFATGNNIAIRQSKGEFVIFLNNDTAPSSAWIEELVKAAKSDPRAGIVTGHLHLFYDQLEVQLHVQRADHEPGDPQTGLLQVWDVNSGTPRGTVQYLNGFSGWQPAPAGKRFRWSHLESILGLPIPWDSGGFPVRFQFAALQPVEVTLLVGEERYATWQVNNPEPETFEAVLPASVHQLARALEQNTGSILFYNGAGRDRGTYAQNAEVFYETDHGQYSRLEEVFSGCGASLLLKRAMLEDIGLLDDDLFMYYEDTDLAWRARARGWKVIYAPEAEIRHIHCGTTREWSPFFIYLIERNRLALVFKNGSIHQLVKVWGGYGKKVTRLGWTALKKALRREPDWRTHASQLKIHLRVAWSLLLWQPRLWVKRFQIQSRRTVPAKTIETWFAGGE